MDTSCPDAETWVAWWEDRLDASGRAQWAPHLASCEPCRKELASLAAVAAARKASRKSGWLRYAAAAGLLAAVWGISRTRGGREPEARPAPSGSAERIHMAWASAPSGGVEAVEDLCWTFGRSGEVTLSSGSRARFSREDGIPSLKLESGLAVIETSGDPVRVTLAEGDGSLELQDGALACWTRGGRPLASLFLRAVHAEGGSWGARVLKGWAVQVVGGTRRTLEAGSVLGEGEFREFRGWRNEPARDGIFRDCARSLLKDAPPGPLVAECRVRKLDPKAEGAVLFRAGGRAWKAPLGVHLPGDGSWILLRIEFGADSVRLVAGGQEYFQAPLEGLTSFAHPHEGGDALALLAWGGGLEAADFRWR